MKTDGIFHHAYLTPPFFDGYGQLVCGFLICRDNDDDLQSSPHSAVPGREAAVSLWWVSVLGAVVRERLTASPRSLGNKLRSDFIDEPCYNLIYLEVAACRLTGLPKDLGRLVPNLRVLNLNYNFLEDVTALEGLTRMKKLSMIGSRLRGTKPLIRVLQRMPEVEMVDVR